MPTIVGGDDFVWIGGPDEGFARTMGAASKGTLPSITWSLVAALKATRLRSEGDVTKSWASLLFVSAESNWLRSQRDSVPAHRDIAIQCGSTDVHRTTRLSLSFLGVAWQYRRASRPMRFFRTARSNNSRRQRFRDLSSLLQIRASIPQFSRS